MFVGVLFVSYLGGLRLLFVYVIIVLLFVYCCLLLLLFGALFSCFFLFLFCLGWVGVVVMVAGWRVYQSNALLASFRHVCTGRELYPGLLRLDEFVGRYVN